MSRARTLADQFNSDGDLALTPVASVNAGQIGGRRNLIINGAMQVAQRGTSFTNPSSNSYTLDRWVPYYSHDGAVDISQSTTAPADFKNSLKMNVTTADASLAASQYYILAQVIEGQNVSHLNYGSSDAKQVTISFWVRSNKTGTYHVEIQTSGSQELARQYTINAADTWEYKTLTWIANTDFTITETNAAGLYVYWWLAAGSDYTGSPLATTWANNTNRVTGQTNFLDSTSNEWYITGVQLELGDTASDFEHRSYGEELALCQRYYQHSGFNGGQTYGGGGVSMTAFNASEASGQVAYATTMRAAPTVRIKDAAGNIGGIHNAGVGDVSSGVTVGWTTGTQNNLVGFSQLGKSSAWSTGNVLVGAWEADAEL